MQLRWEMLEPTFARRAAAAVAQDVAPTVNDGGVTAAAARDDRRQDVAASAVALSVAVLLVALYLSVVLQPTGAAAMMAFGVVPMMLAAVLTAVPEVRRGVGQGVAAPLQQRRRSTPDAEAAHRPVTLRGRVPARTLRRALQGGEAVADWTRAERLYGEVAALLFVPEDPEDAPLPPLEARRRREVLRQCGALLTTAYRVERRRAAVRAALPTDADLSALDAEHAALLARAGGEPDPAARAALCEGASLCAERRESLGALRPLLARLDAQEEAVCQALLLARAALLHQRAAGTDGFAAVGALDATPQVAALRQSVRQIVREARAAGDAAAEIAELEWRAGALTPPIPVGTVPAAKGDDLQTATTVGGTPDTGR